MTREFEEARDKERLRRLAAKGWWDDAPELLPCTTLARHPHREPRVTEEGMTHIGCWNRDDVFGQDPERFPLRWWGQWHSIKSASMKRARRR